MRHRSILRIPFFILGIAAADRDNYGVPHILEETEEATFFGYGYAQTEDHLERMMLQYRDAQGRRAEIQGFSALGDGDDHSARLLHASRPHRELRSREKPRSFSEAPEL